MLCNMSLRTDVFFHDLKCFKWSWRALLLSKSVHHLWGDLSRQSLLLFLFAGRTHMETVVPNWFLPACCVLVLSGLEECWIVEHGITVCVPWRNICALLMHVYILQSELLAFLAVDVHVSPWGYDTWKIPNKKATLIFWNLFICSISFGVFTCRFGGVGY